MKHFIIGLLIISMNNFAMEKNTIRPVNSTVTLTLLNPQFPSDVIRYAHSTVMPALFHSPSLSQMAISSHHQAPLFIQNKFVNMFANKQCFTMDHAKTYKLNRNFYEHMHKYHYNNNNSCYDCQEAFATIKDFTRHMTTYHEKNGKKIKTTKKKSLICPTCQSFCDPEKYEEHCLVAIKKQIDHYIHNLKKKNGQHNVII